MQTIALEKYDAFIFDLDGVVTETAKIHARAWKKTFDAFLQDLAGPGEDSKPFEIETDYVRYVDGIPRYKGVETFLDSRNIHIPYGDPGDPPGKETVCGIGNQKNELFKKIIEKGSIDVYESTLALIRQLRENGVKTAIISSSKNCGTILNTLDIAKLFDTKIDGLDAEKLELRGKPDPDIFTTAARQLGVDIEKAVVVEDAILGVKAGKKGNFGLVLAIDRGHQARNLLENGADMVVSDLSEIELVT